MSQQAIAPTPDAFAAFLRELRLMRRRRKAELGETAAPRKILSAAERKEVCRKTAGRCHICGGTVDGKWQADHVFAHSGGGAHAADNYLLAHALCNNYRWACAVDEFQVILNSAY